MNYFNTSTIIGGLVGYFSFLSFLESKCMGNIIIRQGEFTPNNILHYMKSPFYDRFLWYPALWRANWIIMTCVGSSIGYIISCTCL